ncbi:MAG: ABC transporter ATP-binding protein [Ilumatobacteraceae bacterium]
MTESTRRRALLRQLTTRAEQTMLVEVAAVSVATGLADAATLVGISALAVALTRGDDTIHVAGMEWGTNTVLLVSLAAALTRLVRGAWAARRSGALAARVVHRHRSLVVARFLRAPWPHISSIDIGTLQQIAATNSQIAGAHALIWSTGLSAAVSLSVLTIVALALQPAAALAVFVLGVGAAFVLRPMQRRARVSGDVEAHLARGLSVDIARLAATDMVTKTFDTGAAVHERFDAASTEQVAAYRRGRTLALLSPVLFQTVVAVVVLMSVAILAATDLDDLTAIGAVALLALRSMSYAQVVQQSVQTCDAQRGYLEQLLTLEAELGSAAIPDGTVETPPVVSLELLGVVVERPSGRHRLGPIDLHIDRNEVVGITGPSGAGKSTLLEVLVRLRQPTSGTLHVNHVDAATCTSASWSRRVALVPQQPLMIAGTVADNVRWFRQLDDDAVHRACELAAIADEVVRWPQGYDTPVGDGGSALSVGQRQRLCLARALAGDPHLIVLDEATSALDVASEAAITRALVGLRGSLTVVLVAHGAAALAICDRVVTIDDGRIVPSSPAP